MINVVLRILRRGAAMICVIHALPVAAATITVTPATFDSAVAAAKGGDTLALVGTFGKIRIIDRDFATAVTINASRATFTSTLTLDNVDNLTVGGGTFNIAGAPQYTQAVAVYGGRNIAFNAPNISGSAGGEGIVFDGTAGATVASGTFRGLQVGIVLGSVTNGVATHNTVTGAVSDGIDIANSHGVTASYNSCSAGAPGPGVHPDCVQLWSVTGQPLQSDIIVRNNRATGPTQGFTAFASMGGELRVQIINNSLTTSYPQGVACYECVNSTISYNSLATMAGALYLTNLTVSGGTGNSVVGNVIKPYAGAVSGSHIGMLDASLDAGRGVDVAPTSDAPDLARLVGEPPADSAGIAAIPEPSSWALLLAGFAAVGLARRRGSRAAVAV